MEGKEEGPDDTSIKPVSSLRSRFENLGKGNDSSQTSPIAPRQVSLGAPSAAPGDRPRTSGGFSRDSSPQSGVSDGLPAPIPRQRRPEAFQPRPQSMAAPRSPPLVTVDSPHSPAKTFSIDLRMSSTNSPAPALTPSSGADSPTRAHVRTPSRVATPALEARMSAFLQASDVPTIPTDSTATTQSATNPKPKSEATNGHGPPPINRAAKPRVPSKPAGLAISANGLNLSAPDHNAELTDQSISPFSTPPSSGASSPSERKPESQPQRERNDSDASFVERLRGDSSASVQGRFRADSNASWVERLRGDSNASTIESSSLPDGYFQPPPVHPAVAAKHEQRANGLSRTTTMPARYTPIHASDRSAAGDLPEHRPRLPARPDLQTRSGRTSPIRKGRSGRTSPVKAIRNLTTRSSMDTQRPSAKDLEAHVPQRIPATKAVGRSALSQGFDRASQMPSPVPPVSNNAAVPTAPAPRRSVETRRKAPSPPRATMPSLDDREDIELQTPRTGQPTGPSDFPDSSQTNRRPPRYRHRPFQIPTDYDTKLLATCGEYVVTTGYVTKAWSLRTGENLMHMAHNEGVKCTAMVFKPSSNPDEEGQRIWIGTSVGDIHEVDIPSQSIVKTKVGVHTRREIIRMFRHSSQLWTLDDGGELNVWMADHKGMPSLDSQYNNFRVPKGHTFSLTCGNLLWIATGREIRVFKPDSRSDSEFQVLRQPLSQPNTGDITSGTTISSRPDLVYFGHADGKVSIYNRKDYSCTGVVNVSLYKISSLAGVGDYLWAGYNTGMAYVYDMTSTPWKVQKDWQAHDKQICGISADQSAVWKLDRLHVVTLGTDNMLRIWDGMLEDDWLEGQMQKHDSEYCDFEEMSAAVLTWNAGASKPSHLQHNMHDSNFFREYLTCHEPPDFFVFGFQELVDLEDKKVTAKSFFKSKKKEPDEPQHMSHQYRAWRDHLTRCLGDLMPAGQGYALLNTASLVGLFTCVFVKSSLRSRIQYVHTAEVKRGMGGLHGNKGALILRLVLDDSSICFVNCHLAAGQTQTIHRNNDIAAILEADALPSYPLSQNNLAQHSDVFTSGGDGSMILDHEICILNGDLNYRIDTMGRDTVVKHVQKGDLTRLLERDQLLLSRKKNPGFRLRAFRENPITFAPTYKYNVQTDEYDTSEKKRAPAWCDRILYRGLGKVKMDEYRRWEVRVSDHRPVSGRLRFRIKRVDADRRDGVWVTCQKEFTDVRLRIAKAVHLDYLANTFGMPPKEAAAILQS